MSIPQSVQLQPWSVLKGLTCCGAEFHFLASSLHVAIATYTRKFIMTSVRQSVGLSLASVFLVLKFVVNSVIGSGIGPVKNDTGVISDIFETEVSYYFLLD